MRHSPFRSMAMATLVAVSTALDAADFASDLEARARRMVEERILPAVKEEQLAAHPASVPELIAVKKMRFGSPQRSLEICGWVAKPAGVRPKEYMPADILPILTEAFRFHRGLRVSVQITDPRTEPGEAGAGPGQGWTAGRDHTHTDETTARAAFELLARLLETEDMELAYFDLWPGYFPDAPTFRKQVKFAPMLRLEFLGSRPLVVEFDFPRNRALVMCADRWTSRELPANALTSLLPVVGSEVYSLVESLAAAR